MNGKKGFTLIEMLIIVTLVGILAMMVIPQYKYAVIRAKEASLKKDLHDMRDAINQFYADKKRYPTSLEDLVTYRYIRSIPVDPFLKTRDWELIHPEPIQGEEFDPELLQAVIDVKSLFQGTALDQTKFRDW